MEDRKRNNIQRDYDKEPIIIKDYGAYFQLSFLMLVFLLVLILWILDFKDLRFETIKFNSFESFRILIVGVLMFWFVYFLYKLPKHFQERPSFFKFSNQNFQYIENFYDKAEIKVEFNIPVTSIDYISFCIISELQDRYGRWNIDSTWKKKRKFAFDIDFTELIIFMRYIVTYLFFILPYKIWRLYKTGEPFRVLRKNIFIKLYNRNYLLVNIYSQKDLDDLLKYFQIHNIPVKEKTYLIPHLQHQGWLVDKEEIWTNEFNNKGKK